MYIITSSRQTMGFLYYGNGNLVKKVNPDNSKTLYVGGIYEVDKTASGTVTRTVTYYPAGGATLAPGASAGVRINSTLYYIGNPPLATRLSHEVVFSRNTGDSQGCFICQHLKT